MLILELRRDQWVQIGEAWVQFVDHKQGKIKICVDAPRNITVTRDDAKHKAYVGRKDASIK